MTQQIVAVEKKPEPLTVNFHKFVVNGEPVKFRVEEGLVVIGDLTMTFEKWSDLQSRLNRLYLQMGKIPPPPVPPRLEDSTSPFLQANIRVIGTLQRGRLIKPPFWLRWLFEAVVTKETLRGDPD